MPDPATSDPKAIVRELVDAYNAKSVDRILALYHPDGSMWSPLDPDGLVGHAAIGASIRRLFEAWPEERMSIEVLAADETHAIAEFRSTGLGPEGAELRFTEVYEVRDGRIAGCRVYLDPEELPG
jgi:ketosteroid isomerase-like protein